MGLNDYPQNVNDKMTMTIYGNVGWYRYAPALPPLCLRSAFAPRSGQKTTLQRLHRGGKMYDQNRGKIFLQRYEKYFK